MKESISFENIRIGDTMPVLKKEPVEKTQLVKYAGASGDFNPLHTDPEVGKSVGLGGTIAHGMLIMGFAGEAITRWIPKKYLKKFSVRFAGMTYPGDVVAVSGKVVDKSEVEGMGRIVCEISAHNQKGKILLKGKFEASLPI